jgi:hypothetical protein
MPYKKNQDGSAELTGKIYEWASEFKKWYALDFENNPKIDFGNYSILLIMMFIDYAKNKWENGFLTKSKVKIIDKMITKNSNGSVTLTDPYFTLDFLAENLTLEDRVKWSKEIRNKIIQKFKVLPDQQTLKKDIIVDSLQSVSAIQAVQEAIKTINNSEWQIAFLSNSGVTSTVTSQHFLNNAQSALMLSNGLAGQWVVGFFKDSPLIIYRNGQEGKSYPFRRVTVTVHGASELPEGSMGVPNRLAPLDINFIRNMDSARSLAILENKIQYDALSIASDVRSNGDCFWRFRFYDFHIDNIVNKICISGDGKSVCYW